MVWIFLQLVNCNGSFKSLNLISVEAFGTAWAVDDEDECPQPPPIPDICEDYGLMDQKADYEAHVRNVLKGKVQFNL